MRYRLLCSVALTALVACGDSVVVRSGSGGGPTTTTAPTTTTTGTTTTTTTGTDPPTEQLCGAGHPPCPPYQYCEFPGQICVGQGVCTTKPTECDDDCPGICGCDGEVYCNECEAKANGTDGAEFGCDLSDVEYAVAAWPGGPSPGAYQINVQPPWGIVAAAGTNSATDCLDWQAPQQGSGNVPFIGNGDITWQLESGMFYPCELTVDLVMVLEDTPPPNLQGSEPFTAQDLVVVGGCF
ncbi:MAG: hypothetical protein JRI68_33335 [Deltaproteobacteria bacterium]|nr:hypothetical protein [Deltaproteobacteria bacterium]